MLQPPCHPELANASTCHPELANASTCHPERSERSERSRGTHPLCHPERSERSERSRGTLVIPSVANAVSVVEGRTPSVIPSVANASTCHPERSERSERSRGTHPLCHPERSERSERSRGTNAIFGSRSVAAGEDASRGTSCAARAARVLRHFQNEVRLLRMAQNFEPSPRNNGSRARGSVHPSTTALRAYARDDRGVPRLRRCAPTLGMTGVFPSTTALRAYARDDRSVPRLRRCAPTFGMTRCSPRQPDHRSLMPSKARRRRRREFGPAPLIVPSEPTTRCAGIKRS